jgi:hypothetical protein
MKVFGTICFWIWFLAPALVKSQDKKYAFDLAYLASHDQVHLKFLQKGTRNWLEFRADTLPTFFQLPGTRDGFAWKEARFLVLEVENPGVENQILCLRFFENHFDLEATKTIQVSIFPQIRSQVVIPLSVLKENWGNLPRFPGQLKGKFIGRPLSTENIQRVEISAGPLQLPHFETKIRIFHLALAIEIPRLHEAKLLPVVDSLGQWASKKWQGKTKNFEQLSKRLNREYLQKNKSPKDERTALKTLKTGSGFFNTHYDGKRWWILDPGGKPFVPSGVNQVRPVIASPISGLEYFHHFLPNPVNDGKDSYFNSGKSLMLNYLATNLRKSLGNDWLEKWRDMSLTQLKKGGFNCLGPGAENELVTRRSIPYFIQLAHLPRTENYLFLDFPDPFDPSYKDSVAAFAGQLEPFKSDVQLIGYFLGVQPVWSVGNLNPAAILIEKKESSYAKSALHQWLRKRYQGDISKLNTLWKEKFTSFEQLDSSLVEPGPEARDELMSFSEILIDSLISPICRIMKQADPYHLNFGFRFTTISQDIWYRTLHKFDVYSLSFSDLEVPQTNHITERSNRPVFICDFQVGSLDRGLPSGGPTATLTTNNRAKAIRSAMENLFSRNEVVGLLYSAFYDRPLLGRLDGENYQIGLLDVCNKPYSEVWSQAKKANDRRYELATHFKKTYFREVGKSRLEDN